MRKKNISYKSSEDLWIDDIEDISNVKLESVKFIYETSVKFLECTKDGMSSISNRSVILGSIILAIISFLCAHIILNLQSDDINFTLNMIYSIFAIYYFYVLLRVISYAKPREASMGYFEPVENFQKKYMVSEEGLIYLLMDECYRVQDCIDINKYILKVMKRKFEKAIKLSLIPFALFLISLLFISGLGVFDSLAIPF